MGATTDRDERTRPQQAGTAAVQTGTTSTADRAQAEQIDFLNGMVILLFGLGLFFASSGVLFAVGVDSNPDLETAAANADQRLVDDLLVTAVGDVPANETCVAAYFAMDTHEPCGISATEFDTSAPTEHHWLQHSLGLGDELAVNVTIHGGSGVVTAPDGTPYALGPSVPASDKVAASSRFVRLDSDRYRTVSVRVWQT